MKKNRLFNLVLLLSVYLPFEDFILKWAPVSDELYLLLRQIPDFMVFSLLLFAFITSLAEKKMPYAVSRKAFLLFLLFIVFSFVPVFLNHSSLFNAIKNLKALIRYIFLLNIVYFCRPTERQTLIFMRTVIFLAFIEGGIGYLQVLGGDFVRNITKPREIFIDRDLTFTALTATADTFGTMAYTINYAFFLLIGLIFYLFIAKRSTRNALTFYTGILYFLLAIYFSGSRAAFIVANLSIILFFYRKQTTKRLSNLALPALPLFFFIVAFVFFEKGATNEDFWFFLSPDFVDVIETQRLGMVRVFRSYIGDAHLPFGLSSDKLFLENYIIRNYKLPPLFAESAVSGIEDVYWIALMFYYGLIGTALLIAFMMSIYNKLKDFEKRFVAGNLQHDMARMCKILLILMVILNFISQSFEVRQFSFYFWTIIGLTISLCSQQSKEQKANLHENTAHK